MNELRKFKKLYLGKLIDWGDGVRFRANLFKKNIEPEHKFFDGTNSLSYAYCSVSETGAGWYRIYPNMKIGELV